MQTATTFTPTNQHIEAAENVFIAMAFLEIIKPVFEQIERDILATRRLRELRTEEYNGTDNQLYYAELNRISRNAGFINAENSLCMADNDLVKAETNLIIATKDIHGFMPEDIVMHDHRKKLIDLTLKLLASFVKPSEDKKRKYFDERMSISYNLSEA